MRSLAVCFVVLLVAVALAEEGQKSDDTNLRLSREKRQYSGGYQQYEIDRQNAELAYQQNRADAAQRYQQDLWQYEQDRADAERAYQQAKYQSYSGMARYKREVTRDADIVREKRQAYGYGGGYAQGMPQQYGGYAQADPSAAGAYGGGYGAGSYGQNMAQGYGGAYGGMDAQAYGGYNGGF